MLILESLFTYFAIFLLPKGATSIGIFVEKRYLSTPYDLPSGSLISGKILGIRKWTGEPSESERKAIDELIDKNVHFFLERVVVGSDYLLLSTDSWALIRDYAILPGGYYVKVGLEEARFNEKIIKIYPARDLIVE